MFRSIILYSLEKIRVCWQNQEWKHKIWRETLYRFILLLFEYKGILYKINRFSFISQDVVAFWRKPLSKNRDAFKLLSLYIFWVYSPFPAFNSKHETQLPNLTLFCQFQVVSWGLELQLYMAKSYLTTL